MNTTGIFFPQDEKRHQAAPDFSGTVDLSESFLKAAVEAWRAHRASGKAGVCKLKIEGRWKQDKKFLALNVIPPKEADGG